MAPAEFDGDFIGALHDADVYLNMGFGRQVEKHLIGGHECYAASGHKSQDVHQLLGIEHVKRYMVFAAIESQTDAVKQGVLAAETIAYHSRLANMTLRSIDIELPCRKVVNTVDGNQMKVAVCVEDLSFVSYKCTTVLSVSDARHWFQLATQLVAENLKHRLDRGNCYGHAQLFGLEKRKDVIILIGQAINAYMNQHLVLPALIESDIYWTPRSDGKITLLLTSLQHNLHYEIHQHKEDILESKAGVELFASYKRIV